MGCARCVENCHTKMYTDNGWMTMMIQNSTIDFGNAL